MIKQIRLPNEQIIPSIAILFSPPSCFQMLARMPLGDGAAAIDDKRVTGDVTGSRRSEKDRDALQLAFFTDAAHGHIGFDHWLNLSQNFFRHSRREEPWRNRIDSNAPPSPLRGELASHRQQSAFGGN